MRKTERIGQVIFCSLVGSVPCFRKELDRLNVDGNEAAIRVTFRGTHEAEFFGIKPTGETIEVSEMIMISVDDEGINEYWFEWDEIGFLHQLDAVENPYEEV